MEEIALVVGVCQLLDSYTVASLSAQHLRFFPASVMKEVTAWVEKLKALAEDWSLFHTTIGAPATIISKLKRIQQKWRTV